MLRKCSHELRSAVAKVKWSVKPFCEEGKEPTASAKEKAALVARAMKGFRPDPAITDERDFKGLVYDIMDSFLLGLSVVEVLWHERNGERLPRAAMWVHPRHFAFTMSEGRLALFNGDGKITGYYKVDPFKFIVSSDQSQSGSVLGMGMVRPIAKFWSAWVFNFEWMMNFAQQFGTPFRTATYKPGLAKEEIDKIENSLADSGNSRWALGPEGTVFEVSQPNSLGPDNAHRSLKNMADEEVQMLFLGQTATTSPTPGKLGNDESHMEVRRERIEELAQFVGTMLKQFSRAVVMANYGDDEETPEIAPDMTEPETPKEAADRTGALINTGLPFVAEKIYGDLNQPIPEKGDVVVQKGSGIGIMSDPKDTVIQPSFDEQVEQQTKMAEAMGANEPTKASGDFLKDWVAAKEKETLKKKRKSWITLRS
jgi:phage gp29-like protein